MQNPKWEQSAKQRILDLNRQINKINNIAARELLQLLRTNLVKFASQIGVTLPTPKDEEQEIAKIRSSIQGLNAINLEDYVPMGNPHEVLDEIASLFDRINEISNTEEQTRLKTDLATLATKLGYEIRGLNES